MLKCHNDGKEKWQSFEVWDDREELNAVTTGYGSTAEKALEEYRQNVTKHVEEIKQLNEYVQTTNELVKVDYAGYPLKGDVPI